MTDKKDFGIGDKVWWFDSWDVLRNGNIYGIKGVSNSRVPGEIEPHALIYENGNPGTSMGTALSNCYATKKECIDARTAQLEAECDKIRELDIKGLVTYLYDNMDRTVNNFDDTIRDRVQNLFGFDPETGEVIQDADGFTQAVNALREFEDKIAR